MLLAAALTFALVLAPQDEVPAWLSTTEDLMQAFDREDAPGLSVAIIREGELLYSAGFGLASLEHGVPNEATTIYRIASVSKQFTAACIALLELDEKLSAEEPVRTYVPELPEYAAEVRLQHLLHHTSGIRDYVNILAASGRAVDGVTPEQSLADIVAEPELLFAPGERFEYSNSNYLLLGMIVERVSGETLQAFAHERIFEPLGMDDTHFHDRHDHVVRNRAFGYSPAGGAHGAEFVLDITTLDHVGDGGLFTTVEDLALWDANFYDPVVGGPDFLELMHTTRPLNDGTANVYAYGLMVTEYAGRRMVSHGGSWVGYRAATLRFPDEELAVICLANRADVNPVLLCTQIADSFFE